MMECGPRVGRGYKQTKSPTHQPPVPPRVTGSRLHKKEDADAEFQENEASKPNGIGTAENNPETKIATSSAIFKCRVGFVLSHPVLDEEGRQEC